jgi:hypothetical protein
MMTRNPQQSYTRHLLAVACFLFALACPSFAAKSVSQHGITWTFDKDYPTGQFANGDYWVVGPVKIISISPGSTTSGTRTINGSMVNPQIGKMQGYDSATYGGRPAYDANLNVARGVSSTKPLTLAAGSSLVSTISNPTAGALPQIKTAAVLTVVASAPAAGSFRPPYVGTDKTIRWNKSKLNYSLLRSLPKVANTPDLAHVEAKFARPWLEQFTSWEARYLHPSDNQPDYGRDMANNLAEGLLSLHLNYTNAQKERLLVRLVQYGLDVYGAIQAGARFGEDGGHNHGRKMPMLLAGMMLGDSNIIARANARNHFIFQEDRQTWYVTTADVGRTLYTADGRRRDLYKTTHVGLPEWGEKHTGMPSRDGSNWDVYYRDIVGHSMLGHILTARLMKAESHWNWAPLFDYADRYWNLEKGTRTGGGNLIRPFVHAMWSAYRGSTPTTFTPTTTATSSGWDSQSITAQTGTFTVAWDSVPSQAKMDGITGLSVGTPTGATQLATIVRFNPSGNIDVRNGSGWASTATVPYSAGVSYRFVKTVNLSTKRYSVTVTPKGGSTVQIARDYAFRTEQNTVTKLDRIGYFAATGAHSVTNVSVQAATTTSTNSTNTSTSPTTTTTTTTTTGTNTWTHYPFAAKTGTFKLAFDVVPSNTSLTAEVSTSNGKTTDFSKLPTCIRFTSTGVIQARHGSIYAAVNPMTYRAGVKYSVVMTINISTRKYSMTVTPAGGSAVVIANNYDFRSTAVNISRLDHLTSMVRDGSATVTNVRIVP